MQNSLHTISELATVIPGFSPKPSERKTYGKYLLLGGRNLKDRKLVKTNKDSFVDEIDRTSFHRAIARPGDIIVSTLFDRRKLYVYTKDDPAAVVNNSCAIVRSGEQSDYIVSYLRTMEGERDFLDKATRSTGGAFIPRLSIKDLAAIQIPILPVLELARLGDAQIEKAPRSELIALKKELDSKNAEIATLKAKHEETVRFLQDRIRAVEGQLANDDLAIRIKHGETATLEFKSSLRWNIQLKDYDKEIENATLRTIVAFCNTNGGVLLIGVADDGSILGIENDHFPSTDKLLLHLRNLINDRIIPNISPYVSYEILNVKGLTICKISCKQSKKDVWLKPNKKSLERFFIRSGPSSTELAPKDAVEYIREHFEMIKN